MKKVGLFLLAVVMVAGLAGCSGGGDDEPTRARLSINQNCAGKMYVATGRMYGLEIQWASAVISIHPGEAFELELPEGGLYRIIFTTGSKYWDYTRHFPEGETTPFEMWCN